MRLDDLIWHPGYQDVSYAFIWIMTVRILMTDFKLRIFFVTQILSYHAMVTFFFKLFIHSIMYSDYTNQHIMLCLMCLIGSIVSLSLVSDTATGINL